MKLVVSEQVGKYLKLAKFGSAEIIIPPVFVLTGANGVGKTALIDGLAYSCGMTGRYMSNEYRTNYDALEMSDLKDNVSGVHLADNEGTPLEFERILRYRADETRARPLALDTEADLMQLLSSHGSHGEVNWKRLDYVMGMGKRFIEGNPGKLLLWLLDEPESGLSFDRIVMIANVFRGVSEVVAGKEKGRFAMVVATQHPLIVESFVGDSRLDLGGWTDGDPFEKTTGCFSSFFDNPTPK